MSTGGMYNPKGLDIPAIAAYVQKHPKRMIEGYTEPGADDRSATASSWSCR